MSTMRSQDEIRNTVVSLGLPEHPYFMRRAARAMDLLDTGKVNFVGRRPFDPEGDEIFRVQSQFDDTIYHVELNHGTPKGRKCVLSSTGCTCADHQKNPSVLCKHMIAATIYSKQAQAARNEAITIVKTTDGNESDFWRRSWLIAQGHRRIVIYEEHDGRLFCNCGMYYQDCEHKQLVIKTVTNELKQKRITNECGSNEAKALQDKMNGQLDSRTGGFVTADNHHDNGNGAKQAPSHSQLDLSDPFQQSEQLDIDQIEGLQNREGGLGVRVRAPSAYALNPPSRTLPPIRSNGELVHKLSNGEYVISYQGIMTLSEKHHITFEALTHDDTHTVIAKGRCGTSERVSGKPVNGNMDTAIELAKRNAARQLLPYAEQLATVKKFQLESDFDWQTAYTKCVEIVGTKAIVDIIINDLVNYGKLRKDNPSHYNRSEWLLIHEYCTGGFFTADNHQKEASISRDPGSTNNWSYNSAVFIDRCREAIAKVREEKKSIEANELPSQSADGKRRLQMDRKLRTWLIEADGTQKPMSCREIAEQFDSYEKGIIKRLRAGIDSGADLSTVEID